MATKKQSEHKNQEKRVDLVLEGGGVKGVALVGALAALEDNGYIPQNIAGTSVGAIVGALLAAGYTAVELREIMLDEFDFRRLRDLGVEGQLPLVGKPLNLLLNLGIYEGKVFEKQMETWLDAKGVRTFRDLMYEGEDAEESDVYRYKLQVITSDLTAKRMLVLPRDAHLLGRKPDRMKVAQAVRMSMSVPIFFEPVRIKDHKQVKHYLVDGGMLSNYPIWLFDSPGIPAWPTFGLHLVNAFQFTGLTDRIPPIATSRGSRTLLSSYLMAMAMTALEAHDWQYIEQENFARTIPIPTDGVGIIDFNIPRNRKVKLFKDGYKACEEFLKRWDFEGYIAEFRTGKQHSRTESVTQQLKQPDIMLPELAA
ncbi:MAG: patatin-like phospholipase family protein [Omnitrophica WOR_2 bacterium]